MSRIDIHTGKKPGYRNFDGWTPVSLPVEMARDSKELQIINRLLAEKRRNAWDHERGGEMFHGAAMVRTRSGKLYIAANIHLHNSPTTRNCAEANAATAAFSAEGVDMEITDVWFMGGMGDLSKHIEIMPTDYGRRNAPCGSCLDIIWNHRIRLPVPGTTSPETRIHMLPLNDGSWILEQDQESGQPRATNQIITRTIGQLLPHVSLLVHDAQGTLKRSITNGLAWLQDHSTQQAMDIALRSNALVELSTQAMDENERLSKINKLMMHSLKHLVRQSTTPLKNARVAVVRVESGEYYLGISFENGRTLGIQHAEADAISDAVTFHPHTPVTDIFVMNVPFNQLQSMQREWENEPDKAVVVQMPDGAARDRISKAGPKHTACHNFHGQEVNYQTGAMVHVITANNIQDFDAKQHVFTMPMSELLPFRFTNPKTDQALRPTR